MTVNEHLEKCVDLTAKLLYNITCAKQGSKNLNIAELAQNLEATKTVLRELDKQVGELDKEMLNLPLGMFPSPELLFLFDPEFFRLEDWEGREVTEELVFYRMATWLFDHDGRQSALKLIEQKFGKAVANRVHGYYEEGRHDT